jgi:hypothetical protein
MESHAMTQTATRKSAKTAPSSTTTREIEVGKKGRKLLDKLANFRMARILAERDEKPYKAEVNEMLAGEAAKLRVGDVLVVRAEGNIRGKVTLKKRAPAVNLELLKDAFPEAYEACVDNDVHTPQFDPA